MTIFTGTLTATDGSGQTATATINIDSVTALTLTASVSPTSGPPGTTFTITAVAAGGAPPYNYTIGTINGVAPTPVPGQPGNWTIVI